MKQYLWPSEFNSIYALHVLIKFEQKKINFYIISVPKCVLIRLALIALVETCHENRSRY